VSDVRSNSLTFGKFGHVVLQLDCKIGAQRLKLELSRVDAISLLVDVGLRTGNMD
jgi:hypothetical protein